jgi:rhodanese-related sulfurtransferase
MTEIDVRTLEKKLSGPAAPLVLDVRNPPEAQAEGAIEGSLLIPLDQLSARLAELPRDREIVVVCKRGMRSFNAATWLRGQGRNALNLLGGMDAWRSLGLPVKR